MKSPRIWFIIFCFVIANVTPVLGHGYIVRSIPENRVTLQRAPTRLQYWFSEDLEPQFSTIHLRDQSSNILASGGVSEDDASLLTLEVPAGLSDGAYIVELRPAFASDGHVVAESQVFFVGEAVGGVEGVAASDQAVPLEVVWRTITMSSAILLFGTVMLYTFVLLPAWGSPRFPAGLLPPRLMSRLTTIMVVGLVFAFAGNLLALIQQTMVFFNVGFIESITQGLWQVVRIGSRFGDTWNFRIFFLIIVAVMMGASVYYRSRQPKAVRAFWVASTWILAIVLGTFTVNSHMAGTLVLPWLGLVMDWLHILAVAFWIGGIIALVLVLPVALAPYEGVERQRALLAVMRRFSRMVVGAVLLVIATGIYSATNWFYSPDDFQTTYGTALFFKLFMIGLLLLVAGLHHLALHPERAEQLRKIGLIDRAVRKAGSFRFSFWLEVSIALIVLICVGLLTATPLPQPEFAQRTIDTPIATTEINDLEVSMVISPGGPGVNTFDTVVEQDGKALEDVSVALQVVQPSRDWRSPWLSTDQTDDAVYVRAGDEIGEEGEWLTLVNMILPDGEWLRIANEWNIQADAAVLREQPPSWIHLFALLLVLAAIAWILHPFGKWLVQRLDLSPVNLLILFGASILTFIVLTFAALTLQQQQAEYEKAIHPPPSIVNPVLPDEASLERGARLYEQICSNWDTIDRDYEVLLGQVDTIRDDELYGIVRDGWRSLPACEDLPETERWDVVNFIRTLNYQS